ADLRAPTPSAAAELVVGRKDEFFKHIDRIGERLDAAMHHRLRRLETRLHMLEARPGYAGVQGRVAVRGRHVSELTARLRRCMDRGLAGRARRHDLLRRSLDQFDPRHRLAAVRTRLVSRDAQLLAIGDEAAACWSPAERAALRLAAAMALTAPRGHLDPTLYAELRSHFDDAQIVELGMTMAVLTGMAKFLFAYDLVEKEDYCEFGAR
ncbi:MAG: hypothetical protein EBS39_13355, partial [Gammaproteobacteria bacterium]|nr:hypothetical protein [Gammaproteobacteria bacterium]